MRDSDIILCKGIQMDKGYENVLSYSESDLVSLCRSNSIYEANNTSILGAKNDYIDIECSYKKVFFANYMAYKNPTYENKWVFAFITDIKYMSEKATRIYYQIDVWSTWYSRFSIGKAFIEREHVADDTFGKHTVPENLDVGEMVINSVNFFDEYATEPFIIVGVTKLPSEIYNLVLANSGFPTRVYNGIYNGLTYVAFKTFDDVTKFLLIMDGQGIAENVYDIFMIPKSLVIIEDNEFVTTSCSGTINVGETSFPITFSVEYKIVPNSSEAESMINTTTITRNSTLNGYTPKNNKMFTGEFNYMLLSNNAGSQVKYNYEDFYDSSASFDLLGALCPGASIRMIPANYKNYNTVDHNVYLNPYGLTAGKYPVCSWSSDSYTNWLTQQSVNIGVDVTSGLTGALIAGAINPGAGTLMAGLSTGLGLVSESIKRDKQRDYAPVQAKGNINAGDVTYAMGMNQFVLYQMSCRYEFAKICDDYLSRYGYKVNEIKQPNLTTRTKFNFIKVGGLDDLVHGDIPATDLEEINNIFRKGVTIFHSYSDFGNYTVSNPIRT